MLKQIHELDDEDCGPVVNHLIDEERTDDPDEFERRVREHVRLHAT